MQSTGHTSTHAVSFVPMHGSAMMYIPIGLYPPTKARILTLIPRDADLVGEVLPVGKGRVADRDLGARGEGPVDLGVRGPHEAHVGAVGERDVDRPLGGVQPGHVSGRR